MIQIFINKNQSNNYIIKGIGFPYKSTEKDISKIL